MVGDKTERYAIIPKYNLDGTTRDRDAAIAGMARVSKPLSVETIMAMLHAEGFDFWHYQRPDDAPASLQNRTGLKIGFYVGKECWVSEWDRWLLHDAWRERILDAMKAELHELDGKPRDEFVRLGWHFREDASAGRAWAKLADWAAADRAERNDEGAVA